LPKLYVQFKEFSLEDRYAWLIDFSSTSMPGGPPAGPESS
jgi:hypothetical protein